MIKWVSLWRVRCSLQTGRVTAVVGFDLDAVTRAIVCRSDVRKLGVRGGDFSHTPIDSLPPNAEIDIIGGAIKVSKEFGPGWSDVRVVEEDVVKSLESAYGIESEQARSQLTVESDSALPKRRFARFDYRKADQPLVDEGVNGVHSGKYRHATDAGIALSARAAGHGSPASKATRLARQIAAELRQAGHSE